MLRHRISYRALRHATVGRIPWWIWPRCYRSEGVPPMFSLCHAILTIGHCHECRRTCCSRLDIRGHNVFRWHAGPCRGRQAPP